MTIPGFAPKNPPPPAGAPPPKQVQPPPPKLSEADRLKIHNETMVHVRSFIKSMDMFPSWLLTYIELHINHLRAHREDLAAEEIAFRETKTELEQIGYQVDVKGLDAFTDVDLEE